MSSVAARLLVPLLLAAMVLLVACGDDSGDTDAATTTETTQPADEPGGGYGAGGGGADEPDQKPGIAITTADSQYGPALFDGDRRAIYYIDKETGERPECYGDCAVAWPPVLTEGEPVAEGEAEAKLLGTTERDDGSTQVTYDGRPLYYYVDDPAGQILCHDVIEFGGTWLAVQPSGAPVA